MYIFIIAYIYMLTTRPEIQIWTLFEKNFESFIGNWKNEEIIYEFSAQASKLKKSIRNPAPKLKT